MEFTEINEVNEIIYIQKTIKPNDNPLNKFITVNLPLGINWKSRIIFKKFKRIKFECWGISIINPRRDRIIVIKMLNRDLIRKY